MKKIFLILTILFPLININANYIKLEQHQTSCIENGDCFYKSNEFIKSKIMFYNTKYNSFNDKLDKELTELINKSKSENKINILKEFKKYNSELKEKKEVKVWELTLNIPKVWSFKANIDISKNYWGIKYSDWKIMNYYVNKVKNHYSLEEQDYLFKEKINWRYFYLTHIVNHVIDANELILEFEKNDETYRISWSLRYFDWVLTNNWIKPNTVDNDYLTESKIERLLITKYELLSIANCIK